MPRHCSAGGCKSRDNRETRNAGITFHKLPKRATRRNLWITNSHRADSWDPQTDFVYFCSKHFTPDSFELTGSCSGIRRLKEDAFPTVFDSFSTTKGKRPKAQTQEEVPVRNSPSSGDQENAQQETDGGQTSEEATVQRLAAATEETCENIPASSQETSGTKLLQQESSPSPAPVSRPLSPSRYMRRLPPPPGFYLPKEHSYAQLCPLLWRRRYDQAVDCLEKALRQLHAARRRENRLRSTVLKLRDKRLKHTLHLSQDGCKNRGSWTQAGQKRQGKQGSSQEESETDSKSEDAVLFVDRFVDELESGHHFGPDREGEYCFNCGRGQVQVGGQVSQTGISKTGKDVQPTVHEDSLKIQRNVETSTCGTVENAKDIQIVRPERAPRKSVESSDFDSQVVLQTQGLQHVIPAGVSLPDTRAQRLLFLGSQQKLLLSDMCDGETEAVGPEHHLDLDQQQQLFWIQDSAEGQVILVPVSTEDGLQRYLKMEGADEAQAILVSELDLKGDPGHMRENGRGLSRAETVCDDEHSDQQSAITSTAVEMGEDVREKLKEHLEGFHLQLSTEFIN